MMHREMRRKDRVIPEEEAREILREGEYGFLATVGEDGQPYCIPLNYVMVGDEIFFHCAKTGQKLDNLAHESRVCFTLAGKTQPVYDKGFSTYFESVVAYGRASQVKEEDDKISVLTVLSEKYFPQHTDKIPEEIAGALAQTAIYRIRLEHITGKAKRP